MEIKVTKNNEATRLDKYIKKTFENFKLDNILQLIEDKLILVNNNPVEYNYRIQTNDIIKFLCKEDELPNIKKLNALSEEDYNFIKNSIVYEDEKILVFNKLPGYVVHHNNKHNNGLVDMLKSYTQNMLFTFVNRIDISTSGLILGSKSLAVTRELNAEIKNKNIDKQYYILVNGVPEKDKFTIKSFLKKTSRKVIEVEEGDEGGKESISHFKVIKRGKSRTLLKGYLETGRTHQLRVHLANIGLPIVGDRKYGNRDEKVMHLFSHKIIIPIYNKEIELDYPDYYLENLK